MELSKRFEKLLADAEAKKTMLNAKSVPMVRVLKTS